MTRRFTFALLSALIVGCARNPVTGKSQLSLVSESQEIAMGQEAAQQVVQSIGLVQNPQVQEYVSRVGKEIAAKTERPNLPWSFQVVDDPAINAFALPGGFIFVTRGIMTHMNNEAQLATVLGHEIGHVTAKHSVQQISRAQVAQLGLGIGSILSSDIAKVGQVAGAGLGILFLKYGRDAESQADQLGFRYALNDGYDVRQMDDVFQMLSRVEASAGGGGKLPDWLSTHPNPENRIEATQARLDTLSRDLSNAKLDREQYLNVINNMPFGENPRNGYFRGNTFYHPDLRFQLTFPDGWQTANQTQAVVAVSPQQDAIVQLQLAGNASPSQAAQQFLSQQGVRSSNVSNGSINGLPAASGSFEAETQQGAIQGVASFIGYGGTTYGIIGYTMAGKFGSYDAAFRNTTQSFARLTDPAALNVQPARISLVKIPRDMTVQQFYAQYPSSVSIEQIALINQVEVGDEFPAGRLVKRVTGGQGLQ